MILLKIILKSKILNHYIQILIIPINNIRINYIYNIRNINLNQNQKIANSSEYKLDIFNDFDNSTLKRKIKENLDKMYDYYSEKYPGDINKLRCKLYLFLFIIFL